MAAFDTPAHVVQNRTSARSAIPNNQQVFNAYGRYPMLVAAPGQVVTLTWPRTAAPDGTAADGSEFLNVYYNPNATINAGKSFAWGMQHCLSGAACCHCIARYSSHLHAELVWQHLLQLLVAISLGPCHGLITRCMCELCLTL